MSHLEAFGTCCKIVKDGGGYVGLRHYMNEDIQPVV
jgi:hypothetical protein